MSDKTFMKMVEKRQPRRCSYCHGDLIENDRIQQCQCGSVTHRDCVTEHGSCPMCALEYKPPSNIEEMVRNQDAEFKVKVHQRLEEISSHIGELGQMIYKQGQLDDKRAEQAKYRLISLFMVISAMFYFLFRILRELPQ